MRQLLSYENYWSVHHLDDVLIDSEDAKDIAVIIKRIYHHWSFHGMTESKSLLKVLNQYRKKKRTNVCLAFKR